MKLILKPLAVLLGIMGFVIASYIGVGLLFVPGVEGLVDGLQAEPADGRLMAWSIVKITLASIVGPWAFWLVCIGAVNLYAYAEEN